MELINSGWKSSKIKLKVFSMKNGIEVGTSFMQEWTLEEMKEYHKTFEETKVHYFGSLKRMERTFYKYQLFAFNSESTVTDRCFHAGKMRTPIMQPLQDAQAGE